jgi:HAD superfamily hydrolase (TIGR01509 family)
MFGPTEEGMIKENFSDQKSIETAIHTFYQLYRKHHSDLVQSSKEIQRLLKGLKAKNYKLAIVTGKGRKCFDISMEELELESYFDLVVTGDDVEKAKPHPEGILKVLEELHVKKSEAMFIGDSNADIEAGKRAGVLTIGVQWLSESQTKDFLPIPDKIFSKVEEFERYLENA